VAVSPRSSIIVFVAVLIGLDLAALAVLRPPGTGLSPLTDLATLANRGAGTGAGTAPAAGGGGSALSPDQGDIDDHWALCLDTFEGHSVTPTTVAITYLDTGMDEGVTAEEALSWFAAIPGSQIDVWALEHRDGRRRVALELSRNKWTDWDRIAGGYRGRAVCGLVRKALVDGGVGRPREPRDADSDEFTGDFGDGGVRDSRGAAILRSRHDFEFIYSRRPKIFQTIQWLGTMDHVTDPQRWRDMQAWLAGGVER